MSVNSIRKTSSLYLIEDSGVTCTSIDVGFTEISSQ